MRLLSACEVLVMIRLAFAMSGYGRNVQALGGKATGVEAGQARPLSGGCDFCH